MRLSPIAGSLHPWVLPMVRSRGPNTSLGSPPEAGQGERSAAKGDPHEYDHDNSLSCDEVARDECQ